MLAAGRRQQAEHDARQRGLAAAALADDGDDLGPVGLDRAARSRRARETARRLPLAARIADTEWREVEQCVRHRPAPPVIEMAGDVALGGRCDSGRHLDAADAAAPPGSADERHTRREAEQRWLRPGYALSARAPRPGGQGRDQQLAVGMQRVGGRRAGSARSRPACRAYITAEPIDQLRHQAHVVADQDQRRADLLLHLARASRSPCAARRRRGRWSARRR